MSTLFISHSSPDHEIAKALEEAISIIVGESSGKINISYSSSAERGPYGGEEWREWIEQQIVEATTVLIILTRESVTRHWPIWASFSAGFYQHGPSTISVAIYLAASVMAITWAVLLRSYRNLNTAKFQVIGELEKRLPAQMFYGAEWKALGEGKDYKKYIPLSLIETIVPTIFFAIYIYLFSQS